MPTEVIPEEYSERLVWIGGYPVAITSYRLGNTYYAKATIALFGMGGRIAMQDGCTKAEAEDRVKAEALARIEGKNG